MAESFQISTSQQRLGQEGRGRNSYTLGSGWVQAALFISIGDQFTTFRITAFYRVKRDAILRRKSTGKSSRFQEVDLFKSTVSHWLEPIQHLLCGSRRSSVDVALSRTIASQPLKPERAFCLSFKLCPLPLTNSFLFPLFPLFPFSHPPQIYLTSILLLSKKVQTNVLNTDWN